MKFKKKKKLWTENSVPGKFQTNKKGESLELADRPYRKC